MSATTLLAQGLDFIEPALVLLALIFFWRASLAKTFPAMNVYLTLRLVLTVILVTVLNLHRLVSLTEQTQYQIYFYTYYLSYLACAVAIFFVVQEVFKRVMEPVSGIRRMGLIAFRWVAVISVIITVGSVAAPLKGLGENIIAMGFQMMRCVSILELCLLAFLGLSISSLGHTFRGRAFGIGLGLGIQASMELISSVIMTRNTGLNSISNIVLQVAIDLALITWGVYFFLPEPQAEREAVALPVSSPLIRWNEIAKALGNNTPHVAMGQSGAFFLQDVEKVVDKILTKNSIGVNN